MTTLRLGIDIGSTTMKLVCLDQKEQIIYSAYQRHKTGVYASLKEILSDLYDKIGNSSVSIVITGSVGMGVAESHSLKFLQEVVAASEYTTKKQEQVQTLIDIGGEDAKLIVFKKGKSPLMRMNGSCAGGTGAFIDQMANLLGISISEMDELAYQSTSRYNISSRCGVFAKTDIQNLISRNINKADVCASIFYAIVHQTVTTLLRGLTVKSKLMFCGGPFSYINYLSEAFLDVLKLKKDDVVIPEFADKIPAYGCALYNNRGDNIVSLKTLIDEINNASESDSENPQEYLPKLFSDKESFELWKQNNNSNCVDRIKIEDTSGELYLGIDSGSTTTKIVVTDNNEKVVFDYYNKNNGSPLDAVNKGLNIFHQEASKKSKDIVFGGSCVTGYGEDLIKKALNINYGIVETIAHFKAAVKYNPEVSFILDIGGQDMKAIFVENGIIKKMEVNEACSSGCGSFIEGFANSLGYSSQEFADMACEAEKPCDLGTRCTVFMNSKVKQYLRTNATPHDIAAGLSYSVIKNMLHKVLKIKNIDELGKSISVQGGTFKNLSVVRAMESITQKQVIYTDMPELMGALGCALHAKKMSVKKNVKKSVSLNSLCTIPAFTQKQTNCNSCENKCDIRVYNFGEKQKYYSGNKCEKYFSNIGITTKFGENSSSWKEQFTFKRNVSQNPKNLTIGIPRILNMFENYPFWHKLLTSCGFNVQPSDSSTFKKYENSTRTLMSDNICFPAKLAHSHIDNLVKHKVDRIFMPYVIYEFKDDKNAINSYNCPIVSGYSDVIKSAMDIDIPIDSPSISFKDKELLKKACQRYIKNLSPRIYQKSFNLAFEQAMTEYDAYKMQLKKKMQSVHKKAVEENKMLVMLVGRPYHHDPLIQHKIADIICSYGIDVITEDMVRFDNELLKTPQGTVMQWQYTNNIIKAANWVAQSKDNVHLIQLTSFGCGPDAFIIDEITDVLRRANKIHTVLKVDDITNQGSLKLRIRSLIESIKIKDSISANEPEKAIVNKTFNNEDKERTILAPFFSDFYSPLLPPLFKMAGYKIEILPPSDKISQEYGLKYVNNEVCFPTTVVIGDIIKALKSEKYNPDKVAIGMTQTGGQCRATNYLALIKKSLIQAGFPNVPVVSLAVGDGLINEQPGFSIDWKKLANKTLNALFYCDSIAKLYYASYPREKTIGEANRLKSKYIQLAVDNLLEYSTRDVLKLLQEAVNEFYSIIDIDKKVPKIGIVGEIFVKFNPQCNHNTIDWIKDQGVEVVVPPLSDFAMQFFVNRKVNLENFTEQKSHKITNAFTNAIQSYLEHKISKFNKVCSEFPHFIPFYKIDKEAKNAKQLVSLSAQYGEGWLIPGEIVSFSHSNINHVISLQPFGCIANQIVAKGIEKKVLKLYPDMNLLYLDFDNGVSKANVHNRIHFMINNVKST